MSRILPWCTALFFVIYLNIFTSIHCFDPCSGQFKLVTDVTIDDCGSGYFLKPTGNSKHECIPTCAKDYNMGHIDCTNRGCPPGYYCPTSIPKKCQVNETSCFRYIAGDISSNPWKKSKWKPDCHIDGSWAPVQCKPNRKNGRCFCFDRQGNRIYGQAFAQNAANMTCSCSLKRIELMQKGSSAYTSLHCDSVGNYEPLQCNAGQCWCVEPLTGEITSKVLPEKLMTYLPCHSQKDNGDQYLRQCESEEYAKANVVRELKIHGTKYANLPHILCDGDGTYGPYQIGTSEVVCTWKDKSGLNYAVAVANAKFNKVTCNCARDKKIYELAGMQQLLICVSSGEYYPVQQTEDGEYYCVDIDGQRKSDNYPITLTSEDCDSILQ